MRRCVSLFVLSFMVSASAQPATGVVEGQVTDADGLALPGANVAVVSLSLGATADSDGRYQFRAPAGTHELRVSFVGYTTQRVTVTVRAGQTLTQDFSLSEDFVGAGEVVVLGGRGTDRTVVNSPVPVDVITPLELRSSGFTETQQILQLVVPSYNAPQASITDGSDHVRPATLRGLGPDQVLVLINGKRRHTSALVHVNGSVGRGSTGTDLNSIPAGAIERIEVLRDGAAAQYGSDAIAGVINVVLKDEPGLDAAVSVGQYVSSETRGYGDGYFKSDGSDVNSYDWDAPGEAGYQLIGAPEGVTYTDGKTLNAHLGYGVPVGQGNLFVSGQARLREDVNRAWLDPRQQYYAGFLDDPDFDPEATEQTFDRLNHRYGNGSFQEYSLFANGDVPISDGGMAVYAFGGASTRSGETGCFYRRSLDNRTNREIYPDGFLPKINGVVNDASVSAGIRGPMSGWFLDASQTAGTNAFTFNIVDSHNASMSTGQTDFDAGTLGFTQATTNVDARRSFGIGLASPLSLAVGGEFRLENYRIDQGEESSYLLGGRLVEDGPSAGASTAAGSQCFPGFQPSSEQDETRTNVGAYLDMETNVIPQWLIGVAGRFENYSDFGTTATGKVATRFEVTPNVALRGAASTGYRAPSLAQAWFTSIATNFINGVPFEIGTFPVESPVAVALGATELDPETSLNLSAGITFNNAVASLTVDGYFIRIEDRITFTENFTGTAVADFLATRGVNATGGRFFTNALDTETRGLDVIGRFGQPLGPGSARFTAAFNLNDTEVTNVNAAGIVPAPQALQDLGQPALIGRQRVGDFEVAQPASKLLFQLNYDLAQWGVLLRTNRYGEVTAVGTVPENDQTFDSKWLVDAEVAASFQQGIRLALGANNLFDVYPDLQLKFNSNSGTFPYSGYSPFGFFGRYIYTRVSVRM